MSLHACRRLLFVGLFAIAPLPMLFFETALVPAARYLLLALVCAAVAIVEGAAGPVPVVLAVFAVHAVAYAALLWLLAHVVARGLALALSPRAAALVILAAIALAAVLGLAFEIYRTPFGPTPRANLARVFS